MVGGSFRTKHWNFFSSTTSCQLAAFFHFLPACRLGPNKRPFAALLTLADPPHGQSLKIFGKKIRKFSFIQI